MQLRRTVKQFGRSAEQERVVVACGGANLKPAVNVQAGLCPCFTRGAVAGQKAVDLLCPASCKACLLYTSHRLNDDYGITVVQITHYMEEAATADRVVVMSAGRVLTLIHI